MNDHPLIYADHFFSMATGGAGLAAIRIAESLPQTDVNCRLFHRRLSPPPTTQLPHAPLRPTVLGHVTELVRLASILPRHAWHMPMHPKNLALFSSGHTHVRMPCPNPLGTPHVIHLHWIGSHFIYLPEFLKDIPKATPIIWHMHDANPVTGGCHYPPNGCEKYKTGCGSCPELLHAGPNDFSASWHHIKLDVFKGRNLHLIAPSSWSFDIAQKSRIGALATGIHFLRLPVNLQKFTRGNQSVARQALNIPQNAFTLIAGVDLNAVYKGFNLLIKALALLPKNITVHLILFGRVDTSPFEHPQVHVHNAGYLKSAADLCRVLTAADAYLLPSRLDNSPQTALEAMACGLPVIAFKTGGIPDFVQHNKTGFLCEEMTAQSLAETISHVARYRESLPEMGRNARQWVETQHAPHLVGQQLRDIYQKALASSHPSS